MAKVREEGQVPGTSDLTFQSLNFLYSTAVKTYYLTVFSNHYYPREREKCLYL